jgi:hypothetical protein
MTNDVMYVAYAYEEFMAFIGASDDAATARNMADEWYASKEWPFQIWTPNEMRDLQWRMGKDGTTYLRGPLIVQELAFRPGQVAHLDPPSKKETDVG